MPRSASAARSAHVRFKQRTVWSLQEAREALERLIGQAGDWSRLDDFLISYLVEPSMRATVFASSLAATLELVREGQIEVHQQSAFAPIYLRKRDAAGQAAQASGDAPARARRNNIQGRPGGMAALAERRIIPHDELKARSEQKSEADRVPRAASSSCARSICGCSRRCCLRRRRRSTRRRSARGCRRTSICRRACARSRPSTRRAASTLSAIGSKWTFRTAGDLSWLLTKEAVIPKKLSRAAVETLAVIAYHQPVTRAEVEEIRGVVMSKGTFDVLMETGWIRPRGRRKAPGRPITYGTTEDFLSHFGLEALGDLPGLEELKGSGLLDNRLPPGFAVPMPSDDPALRDDEDPLEPGDLDLGLAPPPERVEE